VALIVAAGSGERLGADRPKAFVEVGGKPLLLWSLHVLAGVAAIERIAVALPPGQEVLPDCGPVDCQLVAVPGGRTRSESVSLALAAVGPGDPVLIHDAARPLVSAQLIEAVLAAVAEEGVDAAIAASSVTDTIKVARPDGTVLKTLDRASLWAVQTPQVFDRAALERALDVDPDVLAQATDDAWLVERAGGTVTVVPAPPENLKVTTPLDLRLAEGLLAGRGRA
jgi:2-C-methyl-D-erythritol 4-phosphate cytidylyltransferase